MKEEAELYIPDSSAFPTFLPATVHNLVSDEPLRQTKVAMRFHIRSPVSFEVLRFLLLVLQLLLLAP